MTFVTRGRVVKASGNPPATVRAPDDAAYAQEYLRLAVLLAERIIGAEIEKNPEKITEMALRLLEEASGAKKAVLEANPIDAETLRAQTAGSGEPITVEANPELARGSLVVHTDLGTIDGRLTSQLERLAAALKGALR
ncbi:MAG: FliH/SctL family protein [Polyangiaceae bacterium]